MRSIKIDKIATVWLLMALVVGVGQSTSSSRVLESDIECQLHINGDYPKVGEIFEVIFKVRLKSDQDLKHLPNATIAQGYIVYFGGVRPKDAVEVLDNSEIFVPVMHLGEWREFIGKFRITKPATQVSFGAGICLKASPGSGTGKSRFLYLVDPETGQYGTKEEYEGKLSVEYRYDPLAGTFTCSPSQNPAPVEENKAIIKMISQLEPALSDSEALLLHAEQYKVGAPKGVCKWDEENQRWTEEKIFEYYLKDGWFKALKEHRLEQWRIEEKKKIEDEWKGGSLNFFRGSGNWLGDRGSDSRGAKTFIGRWR